MPADLPGRVVEAALDAALIERKARIVLPTTRRQRSMAVNPSGISGSVRAMQVMAAVSGGALAQA